MNIPRLSFDYQYTIKAPRIFVAIKSNLEQRRLGQYKLRLENKDKQKGLSLFQNRENP